VWKEKLIRLGREKEKRVVKMNICAACHFSILLRLEVVNQDCDIEDSYSNLTRQYC
jgi:hypothetical protein